jgi:hypothetical protein
VGPAGRRRRFGEAASPRGRRPGRPFREASGSHGRQGHGGHHEPPDRLGAVPRDRGPAAEVGRGVSGEAGDGARYLLPLRATLRACPPRSSPSVTRAQSSNRWSLRSRPLGCPCSWIRARRRCRGAWSSGSGRSRRRWTRPVSDTCPPGRWAHRSRFAPLLRTIGQASRPATGSG